MSNDILKMKYPITHDFGVHINQWLTVGGERMCKTNVSGWRHLKHRLESEVSFHHDIVWQIQWQRHRKYLELI